MAFDMGNTLNTSMEKLIGIVATLRGPDGCPWDRDQTPQTLQPFLVEETYEVLDSLESSDWCGLKEELGALVFSFSNDDPAPCRPLFTLPTCWMI